jgi:hypothetical protein
MTTWGSGCTDLCVLHRDTGWRWVVGFTPRPLYSRRATLLVGDMNTGTWPSRLIKSRTRDNKIRSCDLRDLDPRMAALARTSSNYKEQPRPLVGEGAPTQTKPQLPDSSAADGCLTPWWAGRLTVSHSITAGSQFWKAEAGSWNRGRRRRAKAVVKQLWPLVTVTTQSVSGVAEVVGHRKSSETQIRGERRPLETVTRGLVKT